MTTMVAVVIQLALLWYAVSTVRARNVRDRRAPCQHQTDALLGAVVFAAALLLIAGAMVLLSDGRRFISVRQIFELACIASAATYAMTIQTLSGKGR